jgi:hypothetical protein
VKLSLHLAGLTTVALTEAQSKKTRWSI